WWSRRCGPTASPARGSTGPTMRVDVTIRPIDPADDADVAAVMAVERECFTAGWTEAQFRDLFAGPGTGGLVLEVAGAAAGVLVYEPHAGAGAGGTYVTSLGVRLPYRRQGYGHALLIEAVRSCPGPVALHVRAGNHVARRFYEARDRKSTRLNSS